MTDTKTTSAAIARIRALWAERARTEAAMDAAGTYESSSAFIRADDAVCDALRGLMPDILDAAERGLSVPPTSPAGDRAPTSAEWAEFRGGSRLHAIQAYRERTATGLREAAQAFGIAVSRGSSL